jgi:hypothetical protein
MSARLVVGHTADVGAATLADAHALLTAAARGAAATSRASASGPARAGAATATR